jgi:hypothetical protein
MTADKGGDEDLVFQVQPRKLWKLEASLDGNVAISKPDPLHYQPMPLGEVG